jgi:hypothetical protein
MGAYPALAGRITMRHKLTPGFVQKAGAPDPTGPEPLDRVICWDTDLRGFGLMVTVKGHPGSQLSSASFPWFDGNDQIQPL